MKTKMLACLTWLTVLSGCGLTDNQIIKTESFGMATEQVGALSESEFINIRNGIMKMNEELLILGNTPIPNNFSLDKPASAEKTAKRVAASKALKLYGEVLVNLVNEDRTANLQDAANALLTNTSAALGSDLNGQQDLISGIIVGFGSLWVDEEKANALQAIVPAYQDAVNSLADLLLEDFSLNDDSLGYLKAYNTTAKKLKLAASTLLKTNDKLPMLERARAVQAFTLAETAINHSTELCKAGYKAIGELKMANAEFARIVSDTNYHADDIKSYAKQIQELVNMSQLLTNAH